MSARRRPLVPVLLAAVLLVGAANLGAYAATGGPLLLGKNNTASKTTTLKTTGNGAALKLKSKPGTAPLKVSNATKVAKLNADLVDGLEGEALKTKSFVYELTATAVTDNYVQFAMPSLPPGKYAVSYSVTAGVAGGAATFFGCFLVTGAGPATDVPIAALGVFSGVWYVSGSGYVDASTTAPRLSCQRGGGGTDMTIPPTAAFPNSIVFTRVDDATTGGSTGTGAAGPRPFARGR